MLEMLKENRMEAAKATVGVIALVVIWALCTAFPWPWLADVIAIVSLVVITWTLLFIMFWAFK